jgi:surface polysaccharide O-acyltransferase-like enzyme
LWHHLFYEHPEFGELVYQTSQKSKVCVAMFVLLSGYGLMKSRALRGSGMFWRFAKIYVAYWTVLAVTVPVSCALGRGFAEVYPNGWFPSFLWQVLGLHCLAETSPAVYGFNPTWWFMSLLIPLYAFFPLLARLAKHPGWLVAAVAGLSFGLGFPLGEYPLVFAEGILLADGGEFDWLANRKRKWLWALAGVVVTVIVWRVPRVDSWRNILLAFCLIATILLCHRAIGNYGKWLFDGLGLLGRHCMDIFLLHTFFLIFLGRRFYGLGNPLAMFVMLLVLSLGAAYAMDGLRWMLGVPKLLKWVRSVCDARQRQTLTNG